MAGDKTILEKYLPEASVGTMHDWLQQYKIHLKITRKRSSKLGDYRPPHKGTGHHITVNHDLNPYAFLITLVHEIAHLITWENYRNKVRAHGKEWKDTYRELMVPFMEIDLFPEDIHAALRFYLKKSYASSGADLNLSRTLQKYDPNQGITLEELDEGSIFQLPNGRIFKKGPLLRKRYRCVCLDNKRSVCLDNKRIYLVNSLVKVELQE
jgi:hypothetical protein